MTVAPILDSNTMAPVYYQKGFSYTAEYRGAFIQLASGSYVTDLVDGTVKRTFTLTWKNITSTQKTTIETAWASVKMVSKAFTAPDSQTATVIRDPSQKQLKWDSELTGTGDLLWSTTMVLIEV